MGCGGSKDGGGGGGRATEAVPVSGSPPVAMDCRECVSVQTIKMSGLFNPNTKSTPNEEGQLFKHISAAAGENLCLACAFPKMEMPTVTMGQAMAMAGGAATEMKTTMTTVFHPCPEGKTAQTVLCYANLNVDTSIGFMNAKVKITEDGLTGVARRRV